MKSTIISMIIVLCVLAVVPLFLFGDHDLLARLGLGGSGDSDLRLKVPKNLTSVTTDKKVQVYKWRDQYGVMQFTNTPPPESQQAEMLELTPNTNIVKAIEIPPDEDEQKSSRPKVMTTGSPYTPGGMKDLLDSTADLKDSLNEKQLEQQQFLEQIMGQQK